ncbi:MAG: DNA-binding NarL/FixJ family response regulator [Glaciecola sp.]|jgi:DNA-binding NarL/FixJ family response regulator
MTNLLIADDHPLYRDALKGALSLKQRMHKISVKRSVLC